MTYSDRLRLRAWSKEEKEMYYDVEGQYDNGCNGMGTMAHQCLTDLLEDDRYIVEQCTGLKDRNGRMIYEGDVIKIDSSTINVNETEALVFWDACEASFNLQWLPKGSGAQAIKRIKKLAKHGLGDTRWWEVEIIGNIHENPELLETGK